MLECMSDQTIPEPEENAPEPEGYDAWFREQVGIALREARDPNAVWHTMEEVNQHMEELRAERDSRLLKKAS